MKLIEKIVGLGLALGLAACGGSESRVEELTRLAAESGAQAKTLAVTTPCAGHAQCGMLSLSATTNTGCGFPEQLPYSLVSATAEQAAAAASRQQALAEELRPLLPLPEQPPPVCAAMLARYPACVAGTCGLTFDNPAGPPAP